MQNIKVSVVIPAYNAQNHIIQCINSVTNQTLDEIEIIVVNDGSTDNTEELLKRHAKVDPRIKVITKQNEGLLLARKVGFDTAKGEYIQALDSDDWLEPTACEELYEYAKEYHFDFVVSNFYKHINGAIKVFSDLNNKKIYTREEYLSLFFKQKSYGYIWNKFFSRHLLSYLTYPQMDITLGEDMYFTAMLSSKANKIGKYNKPLVHYIIHAKSVTQYQPSKKMYHLFQIHELIDQMFRQDKNYENYKESIESFRMKSMYSFLKQKPFFGDKEYEKSIDHALSFLQTKPKIHHNLNFIRRLKMSFLIKFPARRNIVSMIKFHNLIK